MAGKKGQGLAWRHTTVLVRADIFAQAQEKGIDISDTCNRALADILGIDYRQQKLDMVPAPLPVIVAKDGGVPSIALPAPTQEKPPRPPVINADDPKAPGTIANIRKQPVRKPAPAIPVPDEKIPSEKTQNAPAKVSPVPHTAKKGLKTPAKKISKGDGLKQFIAAKIVREDADTAFIGKEELYQIFSRWCREERISPVPEEKTVAVALKNTFAFRAKMIDGKSCWTHIRFR